MVHHDWTVGHSLIFHKKIYYCTSFILPGLSFFLFPILAIICHCCLSPKINKKPTESNREDNFIGREKCKYNCNCISCDNLSVRNCKCELPTCTRDDILNRCADILLNLTIATSQFLFGPTTIKLKDKTSYNQRCIKIGKQYYKLSLWTLFPLAWSNACVLSSLIAVFCAFCIIKETNYCDESVDCFLANENNTARITNCSMIFEKRIKVKCYKISFQFFYALSFIGGLLKFVPILFKAVSLIFLNKQSKKRKCKCCLCCMNIIVVPSTLLAFAFLLVLLFLYPERNAGLAFIQTNIIMTMKRVGLYMSIIAQVGSIFLYPWFTLQKQVIEQVGLKTSPTNSHNQNEEDGNQNNLLSPDNSSRSLIINEDKPITLNNYRLCCCII